MDLSAHYLVSCVEVQDLLILCPATDSGIISLVKLAPGSLANDAGLRLGVVCEVLNLFVCPLLFIW
jgi:hypothetical protein